jgi:hypothetical protein
LLSKCTNELLLHLKEVDFNLWMGIHV